MLVIADKEIVYAEGDFPMGLDNDSTVSIKRNPPYKIYSIGFQPAKSIPEISRWFLNKYLDSDCTILDPFAGSGTTIIEGLKFGANILWLDYNPLSRLICKVKTTYFDILKARLELTKILNNSNEQKRFFKTVNFSNIDFWFQEEVQVGLEVLKENILKADEHMQPLFWLAFATTVRKTSDMNDGMLLAAKRVHIEEIPKRSRADVFKYFEIYCEKTIDAIAEWILPLNGQLKKARELSCHDVNKLEGEWRCDAVVTSPPYINAIDYVWASKFELHWLGLVKTNQDRLDLYSKEIGTERIPREEYCELGRLGNKKLDQLIEDIYFGSKYKASSGQNKLRARVVYKYFADMKRHFQIVREHLIKKGYYCFTIGDKSKICGVDIPVAELLTELAEEAGFQEKFRFHLILKNRKLNVPRNVNWAGTIKHDTTIVLEKDS